MKRILSLLLLLFIPAYAELHSERVDIGAGRKIYLECQGTGSPTVVCVSGRSDSAAIWQPLLSEIAKFTRVCAYDRPGTVSILELKVGQKVVPSRSTSVLQPVTPEKGVADLHALLKAARIPGPYVLVGHSYGGLIVRLYASTYPSEVSGLVLIDTLTEFLFDFLTPPQQAMWIRMNSHYSPELDDYTIQERTDFAPSFEQMRAAPPLHPMPAVVLTSDQPYDFRALIAQRILPRDTPQEFGPIVFQAHLKAQNHLAQILQAKHITKTHAGHYIQTEQPQLVIEAIREVVDRVREETASLPSFHGNLKKPGYFVYSAKRL